MVTSVDPVLGAGRGSPSPSAMATGEPARFVDSTWPLLLVQLPAMMNNAIAIDSVIRGFDTVLQRNERFAHVVDCSSVIKFPGAAERKSLVEWLAQDARLEKERRLTVGTAIVLTSGTMRAFVSAINWVRRPATPQVWTATQAEAVEWCCERLVEGGLQLTPAIAALRSDTKRRERESRRTK